MQRTITSKVDGGDPRECDVDTRALDHNDPTGAGAVWVDICTAVPALACSTSSAVATEQHWT